MEPRLYRPIFLFLFRRLSWLPVSF